MVHEFKSFSTLNTCFGTVTISGLDPDQDTNNNYESGQKLVILGDPDPEYWQVFNIYFYFWWFD
jgi:hypothetical protein